MATASTDVACYVSTHYSLLITQPMKKTPLLTVLVLSLLASCGRIMPREVAPPTEVEVRHIVSLIPDHEIFPDTKTVCTETYYNLLHHAWAIPSDGIGEIGSDEWLYYFITGNGGCDDKRVENIRVEANGAYAYVCFQVVDCGQAKEHSMVLVNEDDTWLIADVDNTKAQLVKYIDAQRRYLSSDEWRRYVDDIIAANDDFSSLARERRQEVEAYFQQYPLSCDL